jgi:hypothetical protein
LLFYQNIESRKKVDWIHDEAIDSETEGEFHRRMAKPDHPSFAYGDQEPKGHKNGFSL